MLRRTPPVLPYGRSCFRQIPARVSSSPFRSEVCCRPHYVAWSEQQLIEFHAPDYFRNVVRIITETGLRVYKEFAPMKKDQVDLENAFVLKFRIPRPLMGWQKSR